MLGVKITLWEGIREENDLRDPRVHGVFLHRPDGADSVVDG